MIKKAICLFVGLYPFSLAAQTIVLTNASLVEVESGQVRDNAAVVLQAGKIQTITTGTVNIPDGAEVIDLKGKYLIPGLIDAHVHIRDLGSAKRALESGVTTARSMGVSHFVDVGLRDLAAAGAIDAPEILAAGYHVRPTPDPAFFMDHPELAAMMKEDMRGEESLRVMAQTMLKHDIDWIKTNATARAGLPQTDPREPYYSEEEMAVLVEEGAARNVGVAAHAHGDEGGRAAVLAGVRSIEHGTYLSEETLKLMKERGTFLVPTIAIVTDLTMPGGDYDIPRLMIRGRHMLPRVREMAATAYQLGVPIVAATDTGYDEEGTLRLGQELEELVWIGMSPAEALRAATTLSARMLGVDDHTGRIAEGLDADLVVVDLNPLEDIGAVHDPLLIVNNGKVIVNRLEWKVAEGER